jgi:hypothetical protein
MRLYNALAPGRAGCALVILALLALVAFTDEKNLAAPPYGSQAEGSPANVTSPNDDITFKRFGHPLHIDIGDGNERTLYLLEGSSPQDTHDPAHLTFYHDLALALVPRDKRLPGFPAWVQKVINRENETVIDIRFRLSSPTLRAAAEAKLLSDERAFFEKKRKALGVDAIKIEVLPVPAYELRLYIQDRASGLTLASAQENVRSWTKDVTLSFRLNKESLAAFLTCEKEGTLQFTPYYKARADHYIMARKQTAVSYAVGLKVKQLLDHRQRSKLKNEDENTILPILQDVVNKIARQIGAEINSDIVATDPTLITFLHSDTMLVSSCFDPANTLSFADFRKAFPAYTDEMLAEYLKPYGVTKYHGKVTEETKGKLHTDERIDKSGGGIGFSLDLDPAAIGAAGQQENEKRVLDTIYNATGVRLTRGSTENFYKPAEVKVYKLAQGYEEKKLTQASSVTVTKGQVQSYMDLSSFSPNYDVATVETSLDKMLDKYDHVTQRLREKAQKEADLDAELATLEKARSGLNGLIGSINAERRKLHDAHVSAQAYKFDGGRNQGMVEWIIHSEKLWGWRIPAVHAPYDGRDQEAEAFSAKAASANGTVAQANAAIDQLVTEAATANATMVASQKRIARLCAEIDRLTKEILSILER